MNKLFSLKALLLTSPLLLTTAVAAEQPKAEDLVGKAYGGLHLLHINTDNDRLISANPNSAVAHGSGFGGELGYRFNESTEFRFSYTNINLVKENRGFKEPNGSSAAIDALYFPTQQNFYVLGGIDYLDIVDTKPSLDLGAGYRHYINERAAVYFEGKAHYQFSEHFRDTSARIGFVYFFGEDTKSYSPAKQQPAATTAVAAASVVAAQDTDNDGVLDNDDRCINTPSTDKVDESGCTLFSDEKNRMTLLVNFDNNKAIVKDDYLPEIKKMADFLNTYPEVSLVIEGHTSKVGSAAYNQKISQQRADAIVDVLVKQFSIAGKRLSAVGYGEDRLLDLGNDNEIHAKNRRIEAKVEATKKVAVSR
jgi:OOP family OmpA-OmpF porin